MWNLRRLQLNYKKLVAPISFQGVFQRVALKCSKKCRSARVLKTDVLNDFGKRTYEFLLSDQKDGQFRVDAMKELSTDSVDDVFTMFYIALVSLVADELLIERHSVARESQNL